MTQFPMKKHLEDHISKTCEYTQRNVSSTNEIKLLMQRNVQELTMEAFLRSQKLLDQT